MTCWKRGFHFFRGSGIRSEKKRETKSRANERLERSAPKGMDAFRRKERQDLKAVVQDSVRKRLKSLQRDEDITELKGRMGDA